jgi:hypothetical protein
MRLMKAFSSCFCYVNFGVCIGPTVRARCFWLFCVTFLVVGVEGLKCLVSKLVTPAIPLLGFQYKLG